jgi:putative AlgH/UPF0301 family transcriptional regulator
MARIVRRSIDTHAVIRAATVCFVVAVDAQRFEVAEVEASMGGPLERDDVMNLHSLVCGLAMSASIVVVVQHLLAHTMSPVCGVV